MRAADCVTGDSWKSAARRLAPLVLGVLTVHALGCLPAPRDVVGLDCDSSHPCPERLLCVEGRCALSDTNKADSGAEDAGRTGTDGGETPLCEGGCTCGPSTCSCGTACNLECRSSSLCGATVAAGSQIRCSGQGGCNITCAGSCNLSCAPGVPCQLVCGNSSCNVNCEGSTVQHCPASQVCNRGC